MRVRLLRKVGDPEPLVRDDATLVIIETEDGTPLSVACDLGADVDHAVYVGHVRDPDFNRVLNWLGLPQTKFIDHTEDLGRKLRPAHALPKVQ